MSAPAKTRKSVGEVPNLAEALWDLYGRAAFVVGSGGKITACAREAERLLGWKAGHALKAGSPSRLPEPLQQLIREAATTRRAVANRELELPLAGQRPRKLQVSAIPAVSAAGKIQVVVLLGDKAFPKSVEQDLARINRLASLGTLSAGMAHEIKNALVAVKTFVDLLLEKNRDAELVEVVGREMQRIESIVAQMLKYAGPARSAFSAVRVHDVLDHSLRMVRPQLEGRLISLNRSFKAAPDAIKGDDYQLEQAFVNLLLNAIEAMGPNGSLTVATELVADARPKAVSTGGAQVRIAIADTGVGIAPKDLKHLFEPFFTTKQQGTGLGLTIARRIVQEHRGDISVQSRVNEGTTFNIFLPVDSPNR